MTAYILSIVGVVFLGVLLDVVLPEGDMNKFVKGVFAIIALFVIVSPVQKIFDADFRAEDLFYNTTAGQIDKDFLNATNQQIKTQLEKTMVARLVDKGFENCVVEIECDLSSQSFKVEKVCVDISKMVINSGMAHINKYTEITKLVAEFFGLEESDVILNE